jgi:hypothetical protein
MKEVRQRMSVTDVTDLKEEGKFFPLSHSPLGHSAETKQFICLAAAYK